MRTALALAIFFFASSAVPASRAYAADGDLRVLSAAALTGVEQKLGAEFTQQTGHQIVFTFGTPAAIQQKFDVGEAFDLVIMPIAALEAAAKAGKLKSGTRRTLVRAGVGIAAKEGGKMPDLSTPEALKHALLAANGVTFSDASSGGLSGVSAQKVLTNLGIADQINAKATVNPDGQSLIGKGQIELGLYNVTEIPRSPGVVLAGPVPRAVQAYIIYDAAVPAAAADPTTALAFLNYLANPAQQSRWTAAGLEPGAK